MMKKSTKYIISAVSALCLAFTMSAAAAAEETNDTGSIVSGPDTFMESAGTGENGFVIENGVLTAYTGTEKVVAIPEGVTEIGEKAFYENPTLVQVTFPSTVKRVSPYAFYKCSKLNYLTLNEGLEEVDDYAFCYCNSIQSLTVPGTVQRIGKYAFYNMLIINKFMIGDGVKLIDDYAFAVGCRQNDPIDTAVIPASVEVIGSYAFMDQHVMTSVELSEGIKSIGNGAFKGCSRLEKIVIPDSVTQLGTGIFEDCSSLLNVTLGSGIDSIPARTFSKCFYTKPWDPPKSVVLTIPDNIVGIGKNAFYNCRLINVVELNRNVQTVEANAFSGCKGILTVRYGGTAEEFKALTANSAIVSESSAYYFCSDGEFGTRKEAYINGIYAPDKTKYYIGEELDLTGCRLVVYFNDGTREEVQVTGDMVSGFGTETEKSLRSARINYKGFETGFNYSVEKKDINILSFSEIPDQIYTGSAVTPEITVKDGEKALVPGTDYTVSYYKNSAVGRGYTIITGAGTYTGEKKIYFNIKAPSEIPEPAAAAADNSVHLSWNAVPGAAKYAVKRYENGKYTVLNANITRTEYTVSGLDSGTEYTFLVQAYKNSKWTAASSEYHVTVSTTGEKICSYPVAAAQAGENSITLSWDAVKGATKYAVKLYENGRYTVKSANITGTSYTVTGLASNTVYTFLVQSYANSKWSAENSAYHVTAKTEAASDPLGAKAVSENGKITLTWNKLDGATKYAVKLYENGRYTLMNANITGTSYTAAGLAGGKEYTFLVQAYVNGKWTAQNADLHVTAALTADHPVPAAKASPDSITLSWLAMDGAAKYAVKLWDGGKYTVKNARITGTSYTVTGLDPDTEYTFLVQAYIDGKWTAANSDHHITVKTAPDHVTATAAASAGKITLNWEPLQGASKYAVKLYNGGKYTVKNANITTASYTVTGLTSGTEYTFLVQAYINGRWTAENALYHVTATAG